MIVLYIIALLLLMFVVIYFGYIFFPNRLPFPTESDYSHHNTPIWELYYCSKYPNSIKRAEKNSGFEQYFADMKKPDYSDKLSNSKTITITTTGDLMSRNDLVAPKSRHLWDDVGSQLFKGDLVFGNLEFAVNPEMVIQETIRYSVPPECADPFLKDTAPYGKFSAVAVSNNHINDSFHAGITSTLDYLDNIGMAHSGASRVHEEQNIFPIIESNGIKVAFLSYTFSTNGLPLQSAHQYGTNLVRFNALNDDDYDPALIMKHVKLARERGAELIIASNHWGIEFEYYPSERLVRRAHELMDAGVDIIMGHHPHILNPSEWYKAKDGRNCLCLYSLGNITGYALKRPTQRMAEIAAIRVEKGVDNSGKNIVRLIDAEKIPTYFMKRGRGKNSDHRIIHLFEAAALLKSGEKIPYVNKFESAMIKMLDKEYRRYFMQKDAFSYL